ncbi:helix-turn-helix transcriptional regulator [Mycolicibacterium sp. 120270]|uniref:helix-turn-helix domain-containing protein n=1 Tax=Mycolicibacterium sp. 120270 TaxID=3090600 RepID=UPI00299D1B51|nr:helix-turn-helix transcriptional regulator [Mycolicibacterium sp. 120270]MDX1882258.1 helix-turn-helix transcriptional regulator [Mycolicibacterium sp. 120270]
MPTRRVGIGPTGETVRANVAAVRNRRRLTLRDLSEKMTEVGWPMAHATISEIEKGARRCDVDDLVALATALETSPLELLGTQIPERYTRPISDDAARLIEMVIDMDRKGRTDGDD